MFPFVALAFLASSVLLLAIALPLVRARLRDGTVALVRATRPLQRFVQAAFASTLVGYGVFTWLIVALGPSRLGIAAVPGTVAGAGLVVGALGLSIVLLAQLQMGRSWRIGIPDEPTELVTHGLFRFSRNPIYLGMQTLACGALLVAPSGWTLVGLALVHVLVGFQARAEEEHLLAEHGAAFERWAADVGRFLPWFGRLQAR